jgi:hypothetical protein
VDQTRQEEVEGCVADQTLCVGDAGAMRCARLGVARGKGRGGMCGCARG